MSLITNSYSCAYLFTALEGGPELVEHLLQGLTDEEADRRPDPGRFTIREVVAHLADWDGVFLGRMVRICGEDEPVIEGIEPGDLAVQNNYAASDTFEQSRLFRERRAKIIEFLHAREPAQWQRACLRPEIGRITLEEQALLLPLHDSYHLQQIVEWRKTGKGSGND